MLMASIWGYGIDETNVSELIGYRLPDWQYWSGNFEFRGIDRYYDGDKDISSFPGYYHNTLLTILPSFKFYREKEKQIIDASFFSFSDFGVSKIKSYTNDSNQNRIRFTLHNKNYLVENFYLYLGLASECMFSHHYSTSYKTYQRNYYINPSVGLGWGKTRNVTPIIQAKRLQQQLKKHGVQLNGNEIQLAANQFAKHSAYSSIFSFDRKHFWQDIDSAVDNKLTGISPYAIMEINDILSETVITRFEGYEARVSFSPYHSESKSNSREKDYKYWMGRLDGNFYKNVSYKYQFSVVFNSSYGITNYDNSNPEALPKSIISSRITLGNLYQVVNRFYTNFEVTYFTQSLDRKDNPNVKMHQLSLSPKVYFFFEKNIMLNLSFSSYFTDCNFKDFFLIPYEGYYNGFEKYSHTFQISIRYIMGKVF